MGVIEHKLTGQNRYEIRSRKAGLSANSDFTGLDCEQNVAILTAHVFLQKRKPKFPPRRATPFGRLEGILV